MSRITLTLQLKKKNMGERRKMGSYWQNNCQKRNCEILTLVMGATSISFALSPSPVEPICHARQKKKKEINMLI